MFNHVTLENFLSFISSKKEFNSQHNYVECQFVFIMNDFENVSI